MQYVLVKPVDRYGSQYQTLIVWIYCIQAVWVLWNLTWEYLPRESDQIKKNTMCSHPPL